MKFATCLVALLLTFLISACVTDHGQKAADLAFVSFQKDSQAYYYQVSFSSNIELLNLFTPSQELSVISKKLICSLDTPVVFDMNHRIDTYAEGDFQSVSSSSTEFVYQADIYFAQTNSQGTSFDYLSADDISEQLAERTSLPCKVKITLFPYRAYYSNTLNVPVQQVLEAIK